MPTDIKELCAKLRQDAADMKEILDVWPQQDRGNQNYLIFSNDVEMWELAAKMLETQETNLLEVNKALGLDRDNRDNTLRVKTALRLRMAE